MPGIEGELGEDRLDGRRGIRGHRRVALEEPGTHDGGGRDRRQGQGTRDPGEGPADTRDGWRSGWPLAGGRLPAIRRRLGIRRPVVRVRPGTLGAHRPRLDALGRRGPGRQQRATVRRTGGGVRIQRAGEQAVDGLGDPGIPRPGRLEPPLGRGGEHCHRVGALQGPLAGQHLVEDHGKGEHVGAGVHPAGVLHLLRRHVGRRAQGDTRAGVLHAVRAGQQLGQPEVGHLGHQPFVLGIQQDVGWLDVSVDQAVAVGRRDPPQDRDRQGVDLSDGQAPLGEQTRQGRAGHVLHDQPRRTQHLDHVGDRHHVGVAQGALQPPLPHHPRLERPRWQGQHLHGVAAAQLGVADEVDHGHAAGAQHPFDHVTIHHRAGLEGLGIGHGGGIRRVVEPQVAGAGLRGRDPGGTGRAPGVVVGHGEDLVSPVASRARGYQKVYST